jgi:TorA maturation chaperone TorD
VEVRERLILTRQALYRFYAGLLLYPESERFEILRSGAAWLDEAFEDEHLAAELQVTEQLRELLVWVQAFDGDLQEFQAEWVRLFGSSLDGYCFPYEGAYRGSQAAGPLLAELQKEYARAALVLSTNDLPDHVSVELEYMSYLCGLELETTQSGEDKRRCRIVKVQYLFLENHLGQWLPALLERVTESNGGPFALVCRAASESVAADRISLSCAVGETFTPAM